MNPEDKAKLDALYRRARQELKYSSYNDSMDLTIRDTVIELEARFTGVTVEEARAAFETRRRAHQQKLLEDMEDIDPGLAADADDRLQDEMPE